MPLGYNQGDIYEEKVYIICVGRGIVPKGFKRGGAGSSSDIKFIHRGKVNNLEVKQNLRADFGQKMLKWKDGVWSWCVDDETTEMYTQLGILDMIQSGKSYLGFLLWIGIILMQRINMLTSLRLRGQPMWMLTGYLLFMDRKIVTICRLGVMDFIAWIRIFLVLVLQNSMVS